MKAKLALAGALALACSPTKAKAEALYSHPMVVQVLCDGARGTAWRVSKGRYASVNHVTAREGCKINGKPLTVEYADPFGDFSIVRVNDNISGGIPINCGGFNHGIHYYSLGYARGNPWSVVITLRADNLAPNLFGQWQMFVGIEFVIPGMSGGPILDSTGNAVGSVNAYNPIWGLSWSRPLKDTPLCHA